VLASIDQFTGHVAIVTVPDGDGSLVTFDFLHAPLGFSDASKVFDGALPVSVPRATGRDVLVHVMHPIHCLASRLYNVIALPLAYDKPHGRGQLRAAIQCVRASIGEQLGAGQLRPALEAMKAVFELAMSDRGVDAFVLKDIDVVDAVPIDSRWPPLFLKFGYPYRQKKLGAKRAARRRLKSAGLYSA
jgi:hypothetical protein